MHPFESPYIYIYFFPFVFDQCTGNESWGTVFIICWFETGRIFHWSRSEVPLTVPFRSRVREEGAELSELWMVEIASSVDSGVLHGSITPSHSVIGFIEIQS